MLDIHFPKSNKLHKIFNRHTVKVSYCCTNNLLCIIKTHNKKVTNDKITPRHQCNCKNKNNCPLDGNCQTSDIIYECIVSTTVNPDKMNNDTKNNTTLLKYVWQVKGKYKETLSLKWSIVKSVLGYSNITKKCLLCLYEKLEIINYPNQEELLSKPSELLSKCCHVNKYLLSNYKSND